MKNLPTETVLHICTYLDKSTSHKVKSILNRGNICCNHKDKISKLNYRYKEMLYNKSKLAKYEIKELDDEIDNLYEGEYHCDICDYHCCYTCYEYSNIYFDKCYMCEMSFCTKCNRGDFLRSAFVEKCSIMNCRYCRSRRCYNNKIQLLCLECLKKYIIDGIDLISI